MFVLILRIFLMIDEVLIDMLVEIWLLLVLMLRMFMLIDEVLIDMLVEI